MTGSERPAVLVTSNTLDIGGAERQRIALVNGLAARGWDVTLVLLQREGPLRGLVGGDVTVRLRHWWAPLEGARRRPAVMVTGTTRTEVSHARAWRAAGRVRAVPRRWLVAAHTAPRTGAPTYPGPVARSVRRSDRLLVLSSEHGAALQEHQRLHLLPPVVIPNGVPMGPVRGRTQTSRTPLLLFVGRLAVAKGVHVLLEALESVSDLMWELVVVGDGPARSGLESAVPAHLAARVSFVGPVEEPRDWMARADVLVLPSLAEALPMVLLEAMAEGTPVVATTVGSVPGLLAGGAGLAVPPGDPVALAGALRQVLADPDERAALAERGRREVLDHYSVEAMLDRYEQVLREAVAR